MQTRITRRPDFLDVEVEGVYHSGAALALVQRVVELVESEGHERVLVDASAMEGEFPLEQRYAVAEKASEFLPESLRMGVVAHPEDLGVAVFEELATKQDLPVRVFKSRTDATVWLNGKASS